MAEDLQVPFIGGAYAGPSSSIDAQECINFYPILDNVGSKAQLALIGTPGLTEIASWGYPTKMPIRPGGMIVFGDYIYAVAGDTIVKWDGETETTTTGDTLGTSSGNVWMAQNGLEVLVVDGDDGYIINTTTDVVAVIADGDFLVPSSCAFLDGYFIITVVDSGTFQISALLDGTDWSAADVATAEGFPDNVLVCLAFRRELWLFGEVTTEIFYNSGNADSPFERIPGAVLDVGVGAIGSVAKTESHVFWLADDLTVRMSSTGYTPLDITTPQIAYQISQYDTTSDAIGFTFVDRGHQFYQLTFPTERITWVYDETTQAWHRRASYPDHEKHRASAYVFYGGEHVMGDWEYGYLYTMSHDTYTDNGRPMISTRITQNITNRRKRIFFWRLELEFEAGVGLTSGQGSDPQIMLQWSDDFGKTWSSEQWRSIGKIGERTQRAIWRRLGQSRDRIFKLLISDPVKRVLISAHMDMTTEETED